LEDALATSDAILDTSVLINLLGTGLAEEILSAFEFRCLVDTRVMSEVSKHPRPGVNLKGELDALFRESLLKKVHLSDAQLEGFVALTGADAPNDIGDGEAATLVQADTLGAVAVIDDRKATRIGRTRYSGILISTTADVLLHGSVVSCMGEDKLIQAFLDARKYSRMLISEGYSKWFDKVSNNKP
jgi:hypothetical protein